MSMKRRSDKELTHDNWNEEEEPEEQGEFQKASEETLKTRKMLQPKRKLDSANGGSIAPPANPFSAVNLTSTAVPPSTEASENSHAENGSSKVEKETPESAEKKTDQMIIENKSAGEAKAEEDHKGEDSDSESDGGESDDEDIEDNSSSSDADAADGEVADGEVNNVSREQDVESDEEEDIDSEEEDIEEEEDEGDSDSEENASDGDE